MRMRVSLPIIAVTAFLAGLTSTGAATAEPFRVGGTGSAIGLLQQLGVAFGQATSIKVVVVPSLGSTGGIRAVAEHKLDISVSGRPLRAEESADGLVQVEVVRTGYLIVTSHAKPDGFINAELSGLYKKVNPAWTDGTPIRVILRPRSDSDTDLMGGLFVGMADALEMARRRPDVPTAATDQDNADLAERVKGSLTGMTATQLKTESRNLRAVPLDGMEPTFTNVESGRYRYMKRLYFVTRSPVEPDVERFMTFVRSPAGLKLLREAEVLPGRF